MSERVVVQSRGFTDLFTSSSKGKYLRGTGTVKKARSLVLTSEDGKSYYVDNLDVWAYPQTGEHKSQLYVCDELGDEFAQLDCYLDAETFQKLLEPTEKSLAIIFDIPDRPRLFEGHNYSVKVESLEIYVHELLPLSPPFTSDVLEWELLHEQYALTKYSQVNLIAGELIASRKSKAVLNKPDLDEGDGGVGRILFELRGAIPYEATGDHDFPLQVSDFLESIADKDEKSASELKRNFDNIWQHRDASSSIGSGQLDPSKTGELIVANLESTALEYLNSKLDSLLLEHVLIDALLYAEVVAFARSHPEIPKNGVKSLILGWIGKLAKFIIAEGTAFGLTAILADWLAQQNQTSFWVIFVGVTAIRWLRPDNLKADRFAKWKLLFDMSAVQLRMRTADFNPRLVRECLYDLEKRGAVFSQYVYHLLDKRIARDDLARQTN
jgi:hypothetical protein